MSIELNAEQKRAIALIRSGENVFLSGAGGTGKSTIIREAIRDMENVVLLAPTGIAASNIGGLTIHSFGRFQPGLLCPDTIEPIANPRYRELLNTVRTIVIDEISMVRSDLFSALDHRLRQAASGENRRRPWAGKQIVVIGDFLQLPPVVSTDEEELFTECQLNGPYAFSPALWGDTGFANVILGEVQRQRDPLLQTILSRIRQGKLDVKDVNIPGLDAPVTPVEALNMLCFPSSDTRGLVLCTTRKQAESVNAQYTAMLTTPKHIFRAEIEGKFLENDRPTEEALTLQEGERVMVVANRKAGGRYVYTNGDLGTIEKITIGADGLGHVIVNFDNGNTVEVERMEWNTYRYETEFDRNSGRTVIKRIENGAFRQIPLRSGYAITVHKSQGLTLDEVTVDIGNGCFAPGQLYTALSRCRSLETLHLARRITEKDALIAPEVIDFYRQLGA